MTKASTPYIGAPRINSELIEGGYAAPGEAPGYRSIYTAIVDGRITAEQVNGRYRVRRSQLPQIAELFGLSVQASETAA